MEEKLAVLPADLPEDWQAGQIVAPTGEEVGLSRKHGYNYLMKQVNAVQRGVNQLSAVLEGGVGGFIEMEERIPAAQRKDNTLYGLIAEEFE